MERPGNIGVASPRLRPMADHGEVALRMLDPQWSTLQGTVRAWLHHGRIRRRVAESAEESGGVSSSVNLVAAGPRRGPPPSEEIETVTRFWIERDGRSRIEVLSPDGRVQRTMVDDGRSVLTVPEHGQIVRTDRRQSPVQTQGVWTGDPRALLGNVRLRFGREETVAGRPAVRLEAVRSAGERPVFLGGDPVARAVMTAGGNATVDVATGLLLRFEARDADGRPLSRHEFVAIEVDEPIADDVFSCEIPPERLERTPTEIQLEMLERAGIDVSGLDRDDVAGVRQALDEHFRQIRDDRAPQGAMGPIARGRRPLAETVVPLGPPPDDEEAARLQISEALSGLAPDGRPKAGRIERGEVLDRAGPERIHPIAVGKSVAIELRDLVFLRDDEALVEFEVRLSGGPNVPFPGRVVRRADRWLVSYDTAARLRQMGGNPVPSLLDDPGSTDPDPDPDPDPAPETDG
jgi:outer membrane lipoprotein-sorting protein